MNDYQIFNDQRRLKQVIINLMTNALKFTPKGKVSLLIDFLSNDKKFIKFEVKDTGIGMKPEIQQQLCQPYATFNSFCMNNEGIGMGLYICKKLIGKLGPQEELFISSIEGEGSQFGFVIFAVNELENQNSFSNFKQFFEFSPTGESQTGQNGIQNKKNYHSCFRKKHNVIVNSRFNQSRASIQIGNKEFYKTSMNCQSQSSHMIHKFSSLKSINLDNEEKKIPGLPETTNTDRKLSCEFTNCSETRLDPNINKYLNRNLTYQAENTDTEEQKLSQISSFDSSENYTQTLSKFNKPLFSYIDNKFPIILLVDDSAFNLLILENYLNSPSENLPKFQILKAYDGLNAIELFKQYNEILENNDQEQNEISIILMDCEMPILDGYSATKQIKQLITSGYYKACKIIAYTAHSGLEEEVKCLNNGFDAYLLKPSSKQDFISLIMNNLFVI